MASIGLKGVRIPITLSPVVQKDEGREKGSYQAKDNLISKKPRSSKVNLVPVRKKSPL